MRTKYFIITTTIFLFMVTNACKKDAQLSSTPDRNVYQTYAEQVAKQLKVDVTFKSVEMKDNLDFKQIKSTNSDSLDYANSKVITFVTVNNGKEVITKSIVTPLLPLNNVFLCQIERNGEVYSMKVSLEYDLLSSQLTIKEIPGSEFKSTTSYLGCMRRFFNSDVGTTTAVLGVAGGLGCVVCAGVAGFFTGVAAVGCLPEL